MAVKSMQQKHAVLAPAQLQAVAELFAVLSEPTRLQILQALQHGPASVNAIIATTGLKQANASKQLGILHQAGLLARAKEGNQVHYSIRLPLVFELCNLVCQSLREDAVERAKLLR